MAAVVAPSLRPAAGLVSVHGRRWLGVALVTVATLFVGCGSGGDRIVVSAASSLTDAFTEIAAAFEVEHGVAVDLNFGASSALAVQVTEGAPVDVFASADAAQMAVVRQSDSARGAGAMQPARVFARNTIVVVTPTGSSAVQGFADLARPGLRIVLAGPEVPAGAYAREALRSAGTPGGLGEDFERRVLANVVSEEANVRAVLTKVQLGEADAGIVYATDVRAARGAVDVYPVPAGFAPVTEYHVTVVGEGIAAATFVDFLLSGAGQGMLDRHGFVTVETRS